MFISWINFTRNTFAIFRWIKIWKITVIIVKKKSVSQLLPFATGKITFSLRWNEVTMKTCHCHGQRDWKAAWWKEMETPTHYLLARSPLRESNPVNACYVANPCTHMHICMGHGYACIPLTWSIASRGGIQAHLASLVPLHRVIYVTCHYKLLIVWLMRA